MKIRNIECPNCGSSIIISKSGMNKCSFCSHELYAEEENGDVIINTTINHYSNFAEKPKSRFYFERLKGAAIAFTLFAVLMYALFFIIFTDSSNPPYKGFSNKVFRERVQSEKMIHFVEVVFRKKIDEIEKSDYERIKFIKFVSTEIHGKSFQIQYQLEDGIRRSVNYVESSFSETRDIPLSDFQCFTNLEVLDLNNSNQIERYYSHNNSEFSNGLNNLKHLTKFGGQMYSNIEEFPEILHDPSKLTYVSGSIFNAQQASQNLSLFENLKEIKINYINEDSISSLNELSKLEHLSILTVKLTADNSYLTAIPNLRELYISSDSDISDYRFLNGLPNLEVLDLSGASKLRNLDFLSGMPNLKRLRLENTIVRDLSPLKDIRRLQELYLVGNSEIKDYTSIEHLEHLNVLQVSQWGLGNKGIQLPALEKLTKLQNLDIEERMLRRVRLPKSIESLTINVQLTDEFNLGLLPKLDHLTQLAFTDDGYIMNARAIHQFPNLAELTFHSSRLWQFDFSEILNSKTLKSIVLHDVSSFALNPSSVRKNEILEKLYLNDIDRVEVLKGNIEGFKGEEAKIGDISEVFANLKGMKDLTLIDCDIYDLSFVEEMNELQIADLSKNYISDISPLTKASKLENAILVENPVANAHLLGSKITLK